ncbi:MAG: ABC transporter ATP-binding protein [Candidatus Yanofskybacteria bacterium]|nr:ABC transporter ATP-binding protein [Candidatus Yanofskybacteria bacterium]
MIEINNVSKKYNIAHRQRRYLALRDVIASFFQNPFRIFGGEEDFKKGEFWALKDINISINKGEIVGIIGPNGAGKSTLLKILSRITPPTKGEIRIGGKLASLLEVGTGFHPELTGRENVFFSGSILGMKKKEIEEKFDEIVSFAGVEKFIDIPVKRYSSGMSVRLAFSVAAHMDPDILVVDEVLAVGDAEFQKKSLSKMEEVTQQEDRTILFVSHNMESISRLCKRVIVLKEGKIVIDADAHTAIDRYLRSDHRTVGSRNWDNPLTAPGDESVRLLSIGLEGVEGEQKDSFELQDDIIIKVKISVTDETTPLTPFLYLYNESGEVLFSTTDELNRKYLKGEYEKKIVVPKNLLIAGIYRVGFFVWTKTVAKIRHIKEDNLLTFKVYEGPVPSVTPFYTSSYNGIIRPKLAWTTKAIHD